MVSIKDIAKKVGVAPSTVSRVLANKSSYYTETTANKVRAAAKELGYQKNQTAVELVKQHSNTIAAIVSSVKTTFADDIISGMHAEAKKFGYNLIIVYSNSADSEEQASALRTVIERPVMGILLISMALTHENMDLLQSSHTPYCFLSMGFEDDRPFISSDDEKIGYVATKLLLDAGHRQIGLAGIDQYPYTGRLRTAGYKRAMREEGVQPATEWLQSGDYSYQSGIEAMQHYGKQPEVTGIVAASDMTAIGLLNQAHLYGLSVPADLSIVSIDGTTMCEIVQPKLTSISQDFYQMGVRGIARLHEQDQQRHRQADHLQAIIPIKVVNRDSVRKIK